MTSALHHLVSLLSVFSAADGDEARATTIDAAVEGFDAEMAGIVCDGRIIAATGLGVDVTDADFIAAAESADDTVEMPPLGVLHVLRVPIEGRASTRFVVARGGDPFTPEDVMLARAMVRVMRLSVRTLGAFEQEGAMRAEADRRADEIRRLAERLQTRHAELMSRFVKIQRLVSQRSAGLDAIEGIAAEGARLFSDDMVAVRILDANDERLARLRASVNIAEPLRRVLDLASDRHLGITGRAMDEDHLVVENQYPTARRHMHSMADHGVVAAMAAPLHLAGEVAGSVFVGSTAVGRWYDLEDQELLLILAGYMSVALDSAATLDEVRRALEAAEWQAGHDALTNLANRRTVLDLLGARIEDPTLDRSRLHLLFVDLDRFKAVNDLYGHATGDRVILEVAQRLKRCLRPDDTVGRLAGDEFVVVLEDVDEQSATMLADRITDLLQQPMLVNGRSIRLSASTGVAAATDVVTADELILQADMAMYHAKTTHRGSVGHFDERLRRQIRERVAVERRLKEAVPTMDPFVLAYQPLVNLTTAGLCGFEALLRWSDPELGSVSPAAFVPIAEEADLIAEIDLWVLEQAVAEAATWKVHGGGAVSLSVNVSAAAFTRPDFVAVVATQLAKYQLAPRLLGLEITERVMLGDLEWSAGVVRRLRDLGVRVVLDDFGTGYSSLSYLQHFQVDAIKIDRSFVANVEKGETALVEAMLAMARALGCQAVAEGVETVGQRDLLLEMGCDIGQGWLWGRPEPAEAARARIANWRPRLEIVEAG